jgi:tetratricopeptide (TPR) repeat protein
MLDEVEILNKKYKETLNEDYKLNVTQIYLDLFGIYMDKGDTAEGLLYFEDAVGTLIQLNDASNGKYFYNVCEKIILLARLYSDNGNYEKAETWFKTFFKATGTKIEVHPFCICVDELSKPAVLESKGKATFFYAILCRRMGKYAACLRIYDISFSFFELLEKNDFKFRTQLLQIQSNIAYVHDEMGNYDMANTYFIHVLGAFIDLERNAKGIYMQNIRGLAVEMSKLYDKYDKAEKKRLLAEIIENDFTDETDRMIEELRK